MKLQIFVVFLLLLVACKDDEESTPTDTTDNSVVWKVDDHQTGNPLKFHDKFVQSEEAVVVLGRLDQTYMVKEVQLVFGGKAGDYMIDLIIYRDKEDGDMFPGPILFQKQYSLTASDTDVQSIDLSGENVKVDGGGSIRVAVRNQHNGLPSVGLDQKLDNEAKNMMNQQGNWVRSSTWNIDGDWVLRAVVE